VHHPDGSASARLRALIPVGGSVAGPVDTEATVSAGTFRQVLETLGADPAVHAVIALVLRTGATGDLLEAVAEAEVGVPLAVVVLNQPEAVRLVDARHGKVPAYAYPEVAARALSRAVRYAEWRAAPRLTVPAFPDVDTERAREITAAFLAREPGGGWLAPGETAELLRLYRIPLAGPGEPDLAGGVELNVGVRDDHMFGPLVALGLGGVSTAARGDHAARLAPLTEADADGLIDAVRALSAEHGHREVPDAGLTFLRDMLLRVSRLTDDLPEITELDLHPVIARPGSAVALNARIRILPEVPQDPFLRRLR
jgi:acyl-CoA synthetase (NDP forming)